VLANELSLLEKITAHPVEHLGLVSTVIQEWLLQSVSPRPGQPEIISVCSAWPQEWEASFRLRARRDFLVTSATKNGEVEFVDIDSRLCNAWGTSCVVTTMGRILP